MNRSSWNKNSQKRVLYHINQPAKCSRARSRPTLCSQVKLLEALPSKAYVPRFIFLLT